MIDSERIAYKKGYAISKDGIVFSFNGEKITLLDNKRGYFYFNIRNNGKVTKILVHRFQAFIKFGDSIYNNGIVVRHLNGDSHDNSYDNIEIGTQQDNNLDILPEIRAKKAYYASRGNVKYDDELVKQIRFEHSNGASYGELMKKYNIKSKGTISNIIKNRVLNIDEHIEKAKERNSEKKYCKNCGKVLKRCKTFCSVKCRTDYHKSHIPKLNELANLYIQYESFNKIGKVLNVCTHTIIDWFKLYGFTFTNKENFIKDIENVLNKKY